VRIRLSRSKLWFLIIFSVCSEESIKPGHVGHVLYTLFQWIDLSVIYTRFHICLECCGPQRLSVLSHLPLLLAWVNSP
jgi:hypothetical protein